MAGQLRHIADCLERMDTPRFAAVVRTASREISELRWENGMLRKVGQELDHAIGGDGDELLKVVAKWRRLIKRIGYSPKKYAASTDTRNR